MTDFYQCSVCGQKFKFRKAKNSHEKTAHNSSLDDHIDSKELMRLKGMTEALRKNDYDVSNDIKDESKQRTLRNREVRQKKFKDFTT